MEGGLRGSARLRSGLAQGTGIRGGRGRVGACFISSRGRHTRYWRDWSSDVCSSDLQKTRKHGRAIVRGGIGTGTRTVGLLGAILTYARENGIIEANPAHGVRKAADQKRTRPLSEIGRAACRERVQISAAAVSLKTST